jgi:hypothetical protein
MQNAVSFLEIPLALFTCLVREAFLQEIRQALEGQPPVGAALAGLPWGLGTGDRSS